MKYNPNKGGTPIAPRNKLNTRKKAYEGEKCAENGAEPAHDPHGHEKNKRPHFHPVIDGERTHIHYYYHVVLSGETLEGIAKNMALHTKKLQNLMEFPTQTRLVWGKT